MKKQESPLKISEPSGTVLISVAEDVPEVPTIPEGPPIFGETLQDGIVRSQEKNPAYLVPDILYEACRYLEGNGIQRLNEYCLT